jgi:hypothetical protein
MHELIFSDDFITIITPNGVHICAHKSEVQYSYNEPAGYIVIKIENRTPVSVNFTELTVAGCSSAADVIAKIQAEAYTTTASGGGGAGSGGGITAAQLALMAKESKQDAEIDELSGVNARLDQITQHVQPKALKVFSQTLQVGNNYKPEPMPSIDGIVKIVAHGYFKPNRNAINSGNVYVGLSPDDDSQMTLIEPGQSVTILDIAQDNKYVNAEQFYVDVEVDNEGLVLDFYILPI